MQSFSRHRMLAALALPFAVAGICGFSQAATHTWTGSVNGVWSSGANWSGGIPTTGESGGTIVQFGSNTTSSMNIAGLVVDQIHFTGSGNTINGTTALGISGSVLLVNIQDDAGGNALGATLPLVLSGNNCEIGVTAGTSSSAGNISGNKGLIKVGAGTLTLTSAINSFTGATFVYAGVLALNSNGTNTAIPGDLTIGNGSVMPGNAVVRLLQSSEIVDASNVTIKSDGVLDFNNFGEKINTLALIGGSVSLGTGTLFTSGMLSMTDGSIAGTGTGSIVLGGDISATSTAGGGATIACKLSLNGDRTFTANPGSAQPELTITGIISDGSIASGLKKSGAGTLNLLGTASNTYTGTTTVDNGILAINTSLGVIIPGSLVIGNAIDPAGSAIVRELNANDIVSTAQVIIDVSGVLDINGYSDSIGPLTGNGSVALGTSNAGNLMLGNINGSFVFAGSIGGTGNVHMIGPKIVTFTGKPVFNGTLFVDTGEIALDVTPGSAPNTIVVGTGNGAANSASLVLAGTNAIPPTASVQINSDGTFNLNALSDTIGALTVAGGSVNINTGTLTLKSTLTMTCGSISATTGSLALGGDVTATSSATAGASIASNVTLNGNRTITVNSGAVQPELTINAVVSDGSAASGFLKNGSGALNFLSPTGNTYTGTTTVDKGLVTMNATNNAIVPGPLVIGNAADSANSAIVREQNNDDIASTSSVTINASGALDLSNHSDFIGALSGSGSITLGNGTLTAGSGNLSSKYDGLISGTNGNISKQGTGTLTLTNNNAYTGSTSVAGGTLIVNGSQPASAVTVTNGATLGGTGAVGAATVTASNLSPGVAGAGTLSTGTLNVDAASTLLFDLNSAIAGGFDSLNVSGTVSLGSCALKLSIGSQFGAAIGTKLLLIANDGNDAISGTFAGLPEGAIVTAGNDMFTISYLGGTGNDVELTALNSAPFISSSAMATPSPAGVGQVVSFAVGAADPNLDTLAYVWSFGDGIGSTHASPAHAYAAAGSYNVSVAISDGHGGTVNSGTTVTIAAPLIGEGNDSDGDGFSDSFETAAGTSLSDAGDTPTGGPATAPQALSISKIGIKLYFTTIGNDTITLSGTLPIPAGFKPAGQRVTFDIGGVAQGFTLNLKSIAGSGKNALKIGIKSPKGIVNAQTSTFALKLGNGSFAAALKDEGLVGTADDKGSSHDVIISLIFNKTIFQTIKPVTFKAKKGKSGSAK